MPPVASREFESEQRSPEPRFSLSFSFVSLFLRQRLSSARSHTSAPRVAFLLVVVCIANVGKRVPPDRERENSLERVPKKLKQLIDDDDDDDGQRPVVARLPPGAFSRCLPLSLTEATPRVGHKRKREREREGGWSLASQKRKRRKKNSRGQNVDDATRSLFSFQPRPSPPLPISRNQTKTHPPQGPLRRRHGRLGARRRGRQVPRRGGLRRRLGSARAEADPCRLPRRRCDGARFERRGGDCRRSCAEKGLRCRSDDGSSSSSYRCSCYSSSPLSGRGLACPRPPEPVGLVGRRRRRRRVPRSRSVARGGARRRGLAVRGAGGSACIVGV